MDEPDPAVEKRSKMFEQAKRVRRLSVGATTDFRESFVDYGAVRPL